MSRGVAFLGTQCTLRVSLRVQSRSTVLLVVLQEEHSHLIIAILAQESGRAGAALLWPMRCVCVGLHVAAGFYVSLDGDDAADGSSAAPFRSLQRCVDALAPPGERKCVLRGGVYRDAPVRMVTTKDI